MAQRSRVFLDLGLGAALAQAGILEPACRAFDVVLDEQEHRSIQAELEASRGRRELAEWVASVTQRVAEGVRDGRYRLCAAFNDKAPRGRKQPGWATKVSLGTLTAQVEQPALVWIEDRCISAQAANWKRSIIGSYEILHLLRQRKAIDDGAYFEALLRLRRARVYFIPAHADELVHWLDQATIEGECTETEELSVIRRYFAATLDAEVFIVPDRPGETVGEAPWLLGTLHAIETALRGIWSSSRPVPVKAAMSEWLWTSLSVHEARRFPFGAREPRPEPLMIRLTTLVLLDVAVQAQSDDNAPDGVVTAEDASDGDRSYLDWVQQRLLADRFAADPSMCSEVARHIREYLLTPPRLTAEAPEGYAVAWRIAMGRCADRLPTLLRDELQADTDLMAKLGRVMRLGVNIGPLRFPLPDVWPAFARAIDEGHAEAVTADARVVRVEATREVAGAWTLTLHVDETSMRSTDPLHGLLASAIEEREATLRLPRCRRFFDCSNADFEKTLAEIVTLSDPGDRIMAARKWIEDSTTVRYDALGETLESRSDLAHEDVAPPPIERLLGAWRLPRRPTDVPFAEQLDTAVRTLIEDVGLGETLARLAALPVRLAPPAVQAIADLAPAEREALLRGYSTSCRSPLARLHAVWLLLRFADGSGLRAAAQAHLAWLVEHGRDACASILSLARAALDQFQKQSGFGEFSVAQRLAAAWIHAHEVDSRLRRAGAPEEWIRRVGRWALRGTPEEWLRPEAALVNDVAWPQQLTPEALLLLGLAHALSAEPARGRELLGPLRERITARLTTALELGGRVAAAEIVLPLQLAREALGSFLAWRPEVADVLGEDCGAQMTPECLEGALHWIVQELENQPDDVARWWVLVIRLMALPPPSALTGRIEALIQHLDARQLMAESQNVVPAIQVVRFVCIQKSLGQLRVHDATTRGLLAGAARHLGNISAPQLAEIDMIESQLLDACRAGAVVAGDPEASARRLAELLRAVVDAWPALAKACRAYVQTLSDRLPVTQGKWLWTLLTYLRSLP